MSQEDADFRNQFITLFLHCWILMWQQWLQAHNEVQGSTRTHPAPPIRAHLFTFTGCCWTYSQCLEGGSAASRGGGSELTFKYYLLDWGLTQEADHMALQWPEKMNDGNERIAQRSLAIEPLRSVIHHIPGQRRSRLALSPGGRLVFDGCSRIMEGLRFETVTHVIAHARGPGDDIIRVAAEMDR